MTNEQANEQPKKKNWFAEHKIMTGIIIVIMLAIIGSVAETNKPTQTNTKTDQAINKTSSLPKFPVSSAEEIAALKSKVNKELTYDIVNGDPNNYKGQVIQWGGKVFVEPEKEKEGVYLQVYAGDNDKNFIVTYQKPDFDVKRDDFIIVTGTIEGQFNGENAFGAKLTAPTIKAGLIEAGTRSQAIAPAIKTVPVNQSQTQNGFTITLEKLEIASDETRFFIKVKNGSKNKVSLYTYDAKATQGSKQMEPKSIFDSKEELPSEFLSGVEASGFVVFPKLDESINQVALHLNKPYSYDGDWLLNWKEVIFNVSY